MAFNPINVISTLLPSYATDTVAIFDQDYNQLFRNARAIKAVVKEQSKVMEHPVESGAIITDHRIVLPVEIDLSLILSSIDYQDVYAAIKQFYLNATLLVVQTRSDIYTNQLISALPHEEDPTMYDALTLALSLKEVIMVTAQYATPRHPASTNTRNRGTQQTTPATPMQMTFFQQAAYGIQKGYKYLTGGR
jgi:hypothetical protein